MSAVCFWRGKKRNSFLTFSQDVKNIFAHISPAPLPAMVRLYEDCTTENNFD